MINNEAYVAEYPNPLALSRESESDYFDAKLTLTNKTNNYVIFKVYFSERTTYSAHPSLYWLKPTSSNDITVKCLEKSIEHNKSISKKMLITVFSIEKVINSKEEAKEVFNEMKMQKAESQDIHVLMSIDEKLRVTISGSGRGRDGMKQEVNVSDMAIGKEEEINFDDADYAKAIQKLKKVNEGYKGKIEMVQKEIGNLEGQLENMSRNKELLQSKQQALKQTDNGDNAKGGSAGKKKRGLSQNGMLLLFLIFFAFGAYLCKLTRSSTIKASIPTSTSI